VDLSQLVGEMLQLLKVSISKRALLKINLPEKLPRLRANAAQMRQVVMNLITNASDALCEKGGEISVTLTPVQALKQSSEELSQDFLRLEVRDSGCGMPEEIQARIFDPFFSTKRAGRGMGLAAVRGIILSHGGTIRVQTAIGSGSCFEILLPCVRQTEQEFCDDVIPAVPSGGGNVTATVLIIDDEDMLRLPIAKMLRRKGFSILETGDGATGIDLFQAHATEIDLVLLDLTLPGMSGGEVLGELRKMRPSIKVVLSTAYGRDRALADVSEPESVYYLRKPYRIDELTALLRRVCLDNPHLMEAPTR
jgi:CheY-like chemotaxis protein